MMYVKLGGKLGWPNGSTETEKEFLKKPKIIKTYLGDSYTVRKVTMLLECSPNTIVEVNKLIGYSFINKAATKIHVHLLISQIKKVPPKEGT